MIHLAVPVGIIALATATVCGCTGPQRGGAGTPGDDVLAATDYLSHGRAQEAIERLETCPADAAAILACQGYRRPARAQRTSSR